MEVVLISWKLLTRVVHEILRVRFISKKVSVKEAGLLDDPPIEYGKC